MVVFCAAPEEVLGLVGDVGYKFAADHTDPRPGAVLLEQGGDPAGDVVLCIGLLVAGFDGLAEDLGDQEFHFVGHV